MIPMNKKYTSHVLFQTGIFLVLASLILVGCNAAPAVNTPIPQTPTAPQATPSPTGMDGAEKAVQGAITALAAQYQIDKNAITLQEYQSVEWPDGCLGFQKVGVMCAMHVTDGYRITLTANQQIYEVHTNLDGSETVIIPGPIPQSAGLSFTTNTNDTCQAFIFTKTHEAAYGPCGNEFAPVNFVDDIRTTELNHYTTTYQSFTMVSPQGYLNFIGNGSMEASPAEMQSILRWAELASGEIQSGTEVTNDLNNGLIFTWHREGGIAGFCNDLSVYATGKAVATDCTHETEQLIGVGWLNKDQLGQLYQWEQELAWFEYDPQSTATADAMQIYVNFNGNGDIVTESDQQAVASFAQEIYTHIESTSAFSLDLNTGI